MAPADPLPPPDPDEPLARALEEYHRRKAAGLPVRPEDFQAELGARYPEFQAVLRAEQALDGAKAGAEPRTAVGPFGRYTLLREIGRGGVGTVYEAIERPLGRVVALKRLNESHDALPEARRRFEDEARLTSLVRHDHIVALYEHGEVDGQLYITMDLVPGRSLERLIEGGDVPEPRALAREMAGVVDALAALHAQGIVHRDIKPHNIIVRPDGRMILADFGLARVVGGMRLTKTGHVSATGHYASPEQLMARHDEIDARSDVYNVGSTLYAAIVGQPPFPTEDWNELFRTKLYERAPSPRQFVPGLDPDLEAIILKCLEVEPKDRYASAEELARQLRRFADGEPVTVGGPVARWRRALRQARRRWKPIAAAAALLAGAGWWWTHRPARLVFDDLGFPVAGEIRVNDALVGMTPREIEVAAGEHRVAVRRPGFKEAAATHRLGSGDVRFITPSAPPLATIDAPHADASDAEERRRLLAAAKQAQETFARRLAGLPEEDSRTRDTSPGAPPLAIVAPAGQVRAEDLRHGWVVDVDGEQFEPGGSLVLRRAGQEVWRHDFSPPRDVRDHVFCGVFPPEALASVAAGDRLEFSWEPPAAAPGLEVAKAEIHVRSDDPAQETLARLAPWVGDPAGGLAGQLRAEVLLQKGLLTAAWFEALRAQRIDPDRRGIGRVLVNVLLEVAPGAPLLLEIDNHVVYGRGMPRLCSDAR